MAWRCQNIAGCPAQLTRRVEYFAHRRALDLESLGGIVADRYSRHRVVIAKFVAHRHKEVQNKAKKPVGVVNLYEVQCTDGKAPTVQTWCPRSVQTMEQAAKECPCTFKEGQKLVIEFDLMEPNGFDAKNGVLIRAVSTLPLE